MTISQLITELQRLQQEHGDLPVTAYGECEDHDVIDSVSFKEDLYFNHQSKVFHHNGPHIHLS